VAATVLGAAVIEKHLTLDRAMQGPDHAASLEPAELGELIRQVRETVLALGDGRKQPGPPELETAAIVRRSWHAARDLEVGHVLSAPDLVLKRPADGLPPSVELVGRVLRRAVRDDAPIRADDLALVARVG
jgi:N-acetylneuraminate synthase/N,N'-diacetyllegionaminate synthase